MLLVNIKSTPITALRIQRTKVGNDVIGAVGVGGAPGGHLDDLCVAAALETVKD